MENIGNTIQIRYSDSNINAFLRELAPNQKAAQVFFNQNEEMCIDLGRQISIPGIPVHHDINAARPEKEYLDSILKVIREIADCLPSLFSGLQYYFDPSEVLHPCFFQLFRVRDKSYLYLLRIDLAFRTHYCHIHSNGSNDRTPAYTSDKLFLEADIIPLEKAEIEDKKLKGFVIEQIVSRNWIGETGRGYMVQGIWIDHELTKFFSRLFMAPNLKIYPYYPFSCKYRTLCHSLAILDSTGRKEGVPRLHRALETVRPWMDKIQRIIQSRPFSTDLKDFKLLKQAVPNYWDGQWQNYAVKAYLNESDMKEFRLEI